MSITETIVIIAALIYTGFFFTRSESEVEDAKTDGTSSGI